MCLSLGLISPELGLLFWEILGNSLLLALWIMSFPSSLCFSSKRMILRSNLSCGVGGKHGSDPAWLWLWRGPAAGASVRPLAWEPPCAAGAAMPSNARHFNKMNCRSSRGRIRSSTQGSLSLCGADHLNPVWAKWRLNLQLGRLRLTNLWFSPPARPFQGDPVRSWDPLPRWSPHSLSNRTAFQEKFAWVHTASCTPSIQLTSRGKGRRCAWSHWFLLVSDSRLRFSAACPYSESVIYCKSQLPFQDSLLLASPILIA